MKVGDAMTKKLFVPLDLRGCKGYSVEAGGGTTGVVVAVRPGTERAEGLLIVQSPMASCGLAVVPMDHIGAVDHERKRLRLRGSGEDVAGGIVRACDPTLMSA